jgi:hypothetical protein
MVRPLRAGTSSASPQGVERPVNGCTQAFHRKAWTPLENRGRIVDMIAPVGVLVAAATLAAPVPAALPAQGLVVSEGGGISFVDFGGKRLGHVNGLRFAWQDTNVSSGLPRFLDQAGHLWRLDHRGRRLLRAPAGTILAAGARLAFVRRSRTWIVARAGRVILRMRVGREFPFLSEDHDVVSTGRRTLDLRTQRFVDVPRGCVVASRRARNWVLLCGRIASGTLLPTSRSVWAVVDG